MPSSMIHLLTARKVSPDSGVMFFVGNIAPDAAYNREFKDRSHFRDVADREKALKELAFSITPNDQFGEGVLLHLYLDWRWDTGPARDFIEAQGTGDWFKQYRQEIGQVSASLYHRERWYRETWQSILSINTKDYIPSYMEMLGTSSDEAEKQLDIVDYLTNTYRWHETNPGVPTFFTPKFIEEFTDNTAKAYSNWKKHVV